MRKQQSILSKQFNTNNQIIDEGEIEQNFKNGLYDYFKNQFFKYMFCLIIKLFMDNLKEILKNNYENELKENDNMTKINEKAEKGLKFVTQHLKEKLIAELEKYFPKSKETPGDTDNFKNSIKFDY